MISLSQQWELTSSVIDGQVQENVCENQNLFLKEITFKMAICWMVAFHPEETAWERHSRELAGRDPGSECSSHSSTHLPCALRQVTEHFEGSGSSSK